MTDEQKVSEVLAYDDEALKARLLKWCISRPGGCLEWTGAKSDNGYGRMCIRGKNRKAHRIAYVLYKGPIPEGHEVMHLCDNRLCCNPDHLQAGTHGENMADMKAKGRAATGGAHGRSKLTPEQVREIHRVYRPRCKLNGGGALARRYGVDPATISYALSGRNFAYMAVA